jgi:hypothetical protein
MAQSMPFESTFSVWVSNYESETEPDDVAFEAMEALERSLLRHVPTTLEEVMSVLRILKINIQLGGRSDGLDEIALANVIGSLPFILRGLEDEPVTCINHTHAA